jgi:hypothetical protein
MSLIYSLCVEKSRSRQHATFHLVQYRFILSGLRSARTWYDNWGGPTTVNAVWHKSFAGNNTSFPIAFGTTCIGQPKEKNEVAASRRDFMELLTKAFKTDAPPLGSRCLNPAGNCPEFLSWELVCRSSGEYETLCLSVSQGGKVTGGQVDEMLFSLRAYKGASATKRHGYQRLVGKDLSSEFQTTSERTSVPVLRDDGVERAYRGV